ncbi:unnamed protein product [Trifolium pratense]|uniref:Uncharacterized protein n=1 Tax=Trifolium pratense TaxID=57577 RepID=A0ACB0LCM0_TRIPR|nr:unnamed protein product [Trifolium pratense]
MENSTFESLEDHEMVDLVSNDVETTLENSKSNEAKVEEHLDACPTAGMEFNSLEDVKEFYTSFAKKEGFGVRIRSTKQNFCILVCANEGKHIARSENDEESNVCIGKNKKRCSTSRTDCKASLIVSKAWKRSKWVIKSITNVHNHGMVSPKSVTYLRCHKKISLAAKNLVEKFDEEGVPTGKVATMFQGGDNSFSSRNCWNHLRNLRRRNLDVGDAQAVFNFCKQKQVENPNFFYAIQCDDEDRMINFFWVDGRARLSYKIFGDAMSGKYPVSIITDQDLAMKGAIAKVFPHTRHRLCLWHIRKKISEKLSQLYFKSSAFKSKLKSCIRDSPSIKDFEEDWEHIMVDYNLKENEWLKGLYNIRESWIPVYNRCTFFAGMNTTQRSESINAFFDSFVNSATTLQDFVVKFDKAMDSRFEKERREDFESRHRLRLVDVKSKIEEHAASIYTRTVFGKFRDELLKINQFTKKRIEKNGSQKRYRVSNDFDSRDTFIVCLDLNTKVANCDCQLFQFMGLLCRHILVIFQLKNIVEIPDMYILKRWTKDANKGVGFIEDGTKFSSEENSATLRSLHVHNQASLLPGLAAKYEKIYKLISSDLEETYRKALIMENELDIENNIIPSDASCQNLIHEQLCVSSESNIKDPRSSQTKGRKKDARKETQHGRIKSSLELSVNRSQGKRNCKVCQKPGHNRRSCTQKISGQSMEQHT